MATLNLNLFTDPFLNSFHKHGEAACLTLQERLDEGFFSLTEAATKIESFTEKVRSMGKKYQEEKLIATSSKALQGQHAEFMEEYQGYKETELKAVILFENIKKTIQFIQPAHRSRADEKSLQENLPIYYAELKHSEEIFSKYASKLKNSQSILSPLKHKLSAAINSRTLTSALDKFRTIVENHGAYPSRRSRLLHHIVPSITVEKTPNSTSSRRKSESPLYSSSKPSWKTLPLSLITHSQSSDALLTSSSRVSTSASEDLIPLSKTSWESISLSPRREGLISSREIVRLSPSPQRRARLDSPREITPLSPSPQRRAGSSPQPLTRERTRSPHRVSPLILSGSGGNTPHSLSNSPRERLTQLHS